LNSVSFRLSLLVINDIAMPGVSGEVFTSIGPRLKKESPFDRTIMTAHCNGSSGYVPGAGICAACQWGCSFL
jgi:neutral ceramidase